MHEFPDELQIGRFREELFAWSDQNPRPLPWKGENDPYKIWLSEIILQQTRVEQGLPYYQKFIAAYPSIHHLAEAPEDELLKHWEGLGYYARARNMHAAARYIARELDGKFPTSYETIRALKGVGDYTAAAIASFAFGLPHAVVDGNVYRVLARRWGIKIPSDSNAGRKYFAALAQALLDPLRPGAHNQAMMDFGATCCTPQQPLCMFCPFRAECVAFNSDQLRELPVKSKALVRKKRDFIYLIINHDDHVLVRKRTGDDIWKGLWEFPQIEKLPEKLPFKGQLIHISAPYRQQLTHQEVTAVFCEVYLSDNEYPDALDHSLLADCERVARKNLKKNIAFPRVIASYLENNVLTLR
ncbi:MAG: A/G-specific adenine glycosylase [Saprospiraceae bacterium]|nr:A/G-specific adenine glycosylase [Saprospiraceae bacterium]